MGWQQVQPDDVFELFDELRTTRDFEAAQQMGLQAIRHIHPDRWRPARQDAFLTHEKNARRARLHGHPAEPQEIRSNQLIAF